MADIFNRQPVNIRTPLTADRGTINWGGIVTNAIQISISAAQPIQRRHTIGNNDAVIFSGQPAGSLNITRLMTTDVKALYTSPGWSSCTPGTISVSFGGCDGSGAAVTYTATGCLVSNVGIQAEAEGLSVIDNVAIEFLQLFVN